MGKWFKDSSEINNSEFDQIAQRICEGIDLSELENCFAGLSLIEPREKEYNRTKCDGFVSGTDDIKITERRFCKCLYYSNYKGKKPIKTECGTCRYQSIEWFKATPVEGNFSIECYEVVPTNKGSGIGNIDILLSDDNYFYVTEVKPENSTESLLRMVAEIETYYRVIINDRQFIKDFGEKPIRKAIMFFKDSEQARQFKDISYTNYAKYTKQIIQLLGISVLELSLVHKKIKITAIA